MARQSRTAFISEPQRDRVPWKAGSCWRLSVTRRYAVQDACDGVGQKKQHRSKDWTGTGIRRKRYHKLINSRDQQQRNTTAMEHSRKWHPASPLHRDNTDLKKSITWYIESPRNTNHVTQSKISTWKNDAPVSSMNRHNFTSDNSFYTWCKGWA